MSFRAVVGFSRSSAAAFAVLMGRYHLHGPPSSRLKSRRDSSPGQQRALFSPAAGAASLVSCLGCSMCHQQFPGHSSGSVPILCQNSFFFFHTQIPVPAGKSSLPRGFAPSRLVFSRRFLPARSTSGIAAGEFSSGEEFDGKKRLSASDLHGSPPLKAGLKTWEGPAER